MKGKLAVILILLFGGMLMVGVSDGVYASDQDSKSKPFIDTLTGLWVYKTPEIEAQYEGGMEHFNYELATKWWAEVFKRNPPKEIGGFKFCIQFVVTTEGNIVGVRPYSKKDKSGYSKFLADYLNSSPKVIRKWIPARIGGRKVNQIMVYGGYMCLQGTL